MFGLRFMFGLALDFSQESLQKHRCSSPSGVRDALVDAFQHARYYVGHVIYYSEFKVLKWFKFTLEKCFM